ncbi:MAG: DNA internalization-related competence protein ComEC/Rec2 [Desulfuromonas sp.]|nr:DNA internalization-related competence protein ComEC/Rec2 [Desulfuromonas sp.]
MNPIKRIHFNSIWLLLLAYVSGILINAQSSTLLWERYHWLLLSCATATLLLSCITRYIRPATALAILVFTLGAGLYSAGLHPPASTTDLSQLYTKNEVSVYANVLNIDPQPQRWRMDVAIEQITDHHLTTPAQGKLRVQVLAPFTASDTTVDNSRLTILPGDHIVFRAKLYAPRMFDIPAEFNYPRYLAGQGIFTCASIKDSTSIIRLNTQHLSWRQTIERWRCRVGRTVEALFPPEQSAYLLSLTLGQKTRLSTTQREQLAAFGISHLFSISGLHLGLLTAILYQLMNLVYRRSEYLMLKLPAQTAVPALCLPVIIFYLVFTGAAIPTIRAALIVTIGLFALLTQRHTSPLNLLALAAFVILGFDPLALFSASFQLSFAGVGAILFCMPTFYHLLKHRAVRWLLMPAWLTLIATLATTPIALWHFHTLAPAALICNLYTVPIIGLAALPSALLGTALIGIIPSIGFALLQCSSWLINFTLHLSQQIAQGPLSAQMLFLSPVQSALIALCCLTLLSLCSKSWRSCTVIAIASGLIWLSSCWQSATPALQLTALSIGQGDSLLLRLADDKTLLIDGGGFFSPTFDVGKRLLAPALGSMGVNHLDAVVLTHDHPDHRKGLIYILRNFSVDQFWCSIPLPELHYSLQQVIAERAISVRLFTPGWSSIPTGSMTTLDIFAPPGSHNSMNDRSLTLLASHGHDGVLLTGDLEQHGIELLLDHQLPAPVTLLKLPHHGSRRSAPQQLMHRTHPEFAIASVGYGNSYGFPHAEVVSEVDRVGAKLIRTDLDGTVQFSSWGAGWTEDRL